MANRFLNNITINDEYTLPSADGTADQIITTDGAGQLSFVDQSTLNSGSAERTEILVKNVHGSALSKGDPVYIVGSVGASDRLEVALANASNSAKMPCVGLLTQDLANNGEGTATVTGKLRNLITSPIDGATPTENDTIYVRPGGGLTLTKPTGPSNLIQNVGQVGRVSTSSDGNIVVSAILRSNDVPNLTTGKIWVGSSTYTTESGVVHLDETNNRLGINQTSPIGAVHIVGPNTNPAMTTSALVVEQGDGAKILIDGNDIDAAAGMLYLNDYSTNDVVFGGQIRVGGGGSPVGNSWFANGNVGIGTTSPASGYKLDVNGLGAFNTAISIQGVDTGNPTAANEEIRLSGYGIMGSRGSFYITNANASGAMFFGIGGAHNANTKMTINSSGSVGIGTTSPSEKLEVAGKIKMSENSSYPVTIKNLSANANAIETNTALEIIAGNNYGISFKDGSTTNLTINGYNGNVGVATTSPSQKFHVNGTALIESFLYIDDTSSSIYRFFNELIIQNTASTSISIGGGPGSVTNNLEVNGAITATAATDAYKGYIKSIITTGYSMKSASTAYQYIPYNSYALTTSQAYYNRTVAAYNGRVKKIIVKRIDGASADATGMKFKKEINGTVNATEYTATVLSGSGNFQATYNFANSDFTFSAGDSIGVLMQSSGGTGMIGAGAIQIVLEYNIT